MRTIHLPSMYPLSSLAALWLNPSHTRGPVEDIPAPCKYTLNYLRYI